MAAILTFSCNFQLHTQIHLPNVIFPWSEANEI